MIEHAAAIRAFPSHGVCPKRFLHTSHQSQFPVVRLGAEPRRAERVAEPAVGSRARLAFRRGFPFARVRSRHVATSLPVPRALERVHETTAGFGVKTVKTAGLAAEPRAVPCRLRRRRRGVQRVLFPRIRGSPPPRARAEAPSRASQSSGASFQPPRRTPTSGRGTAGAARGGGGSGGGGGTGPPPPSAAAAGRRAYPRRPYGASVASPSRIISAASRSRISCLSPTASEAKEMAVPAVSSWPKSMSGSSLQPWNTRMPPVRRPMELKKTSWSRDTSGRDARTWYSPIAETMTLAPRIALGPRSTFTSARTETGAPRGEPRRLPGPEADAARRARLPAGAGSRGRERARGARGGKTGASRARRARTRTPQAKPWRLALRRAEDNAREKGHVTAFPRGRRRRRVVQSNQKQTLVSSYLRVYSIFFPFPSLRRVFHRRTPHASLLLASRWTMTTA